MSFDNAELERFRVPRGPRKGSGAVRCPPLIPARLTHHAVCEFFDRMLDVPSRGAVEQYLAYGLLRTHFEWSDDRLNVQTKDRFATDLPGSPGDIQVVRFAANTTEAFVVAEHTWCDPEAIRKAIDVIDKYGIDRVTILGRLDHVPIPDVIARWLQRSGVRLNSDPNRIPNRIQVLELRTALQVFAALIPNVGGLALSLGYAFEWIRTIADAQHAARFIHLCNELTFIKR